MKIGLLVLLGITVASFTSCMSVLSSGPLGHETFALPVAELRDSPAAMEAFGFYGFSTPISINMMDNSQNAHAGFGWSLSGSPWTGFMFNFPAAASVFVGTTHIEHSAKKVNDFYYYGGTAQFQPSISSINFDPPLRLSIGINSWLNYEDGAYRNYRLTITKSFDLSPSQFSGGLGSWIELALGVPGENGIRVSWGEIYPTLDMDMFSGTTEFKALQEKIELWHDKGGERIGYGLTFTTLLNFGPFIVFVKHF